ncbi:MAG: WD40/YVTN/BNR-like repeat-containing protein [Geodermatophilaceae bacterium]
MSQTMVLIGTRKGLWTATSDDDRQSWTLRGPDLGLNEVAACAIDTRGDTPRLFAGASSSHWGPAMSYSDDLGASWIEPDPAPISFPKETDAALARVWQITPGPADQPDLIWAGTEPSALWRSEDRGVSFTLNQGLWDHPHRPEWEPGGGGQALHTILPHPAERRQMHIAMSTGGVYRTADDGASWNPANRGIQGSFLPADEFPEYGQCVHKVARHPERPNQMFAQNHGGVYRSDDQGESWTSIAEGLPGDFGFNMVVHPHDPGTVYILPLVADMQRFAPEGRCRVYRSRDAGQTWEELSKGLPDQQFYATVMRDAMCADDLPTTGIYFGTRSGSVFASADEGKSWAEIASHLPDVLCVRAGKVS